VVTLDQNYRSTNNILQASNALIEHNSNRYEKKLWSAHGNGDKIGVFIAQSEKQEAEFVAQRILRHVADTHISYDEVAVFYRTNAQSRPFEDALLSRRIPYTIIGGQSFYARREIKDLLAFLRQVISNSDLISFLRTINLPKRGLGPTTLDKLVDAASKRGVPILQFCNEIASYSEVKLSAKQQSGLNEYLRIVKHLREKRPSLKLHELIVEAISESRYLNYLQEDPETFQDRKENIDELIGKAAEWEEEHENPTLQAFLEELSLRSTTDELTDQPTIKLMTLHNSKGLEFPLVFLVGLEEDLFPHINSKDNAEALQEERRLCYVGMTRAKKNLYLTAATYRFMWGTARSMVRSRFFKEIPAEFLQNLSPHMQTPHYETTQTDGDGFAPGEKVYHQQFGSGTIQRAFQSSFGLTYEVHFPDSDTTRTLVAKFAKLQSEPN
jgi:DNA helicase-2/ATP-dependent DNA helicase PcrA